LLTKWQNETPVAGTTGVSSRFKVEHPRLVVFVLSVARFGGDNTIIVL